ncbi:hypothetical protein SAMN04487904_107164 [Actinopolyspora lacussalsi subsp. righensis]|uniref:Uncharacterized protein n=1 Tax=Actinopolyspora righensis TaxID=995060 RepID=A0A1I7AKS0_9ACTN|nr:hypothetical protein SAMN04487904_107164 [Actinopolyspora righensis]
MLGLLMTKLCRSQGITRPKRVRPWSCGGPPDTDDPLLNRDRDRFQPEELTGRVLRSGRSQR